MESWEGAQLNKAKEILAEIKATSKEKTEKQQTTTTKPEPKQAQPQGGTKYQTYHVTMNIDAQSIDDLRKLKKLLSELDGDNDPVTA